MDDASKYKNRPDTPVCSNVHGRVCFHLQNGVWETERSQQSFTTSEWHHFSATCMSHIQLIGQYLHFWSAALCTFRCSTNKLYLSWPCVLYSNLIYSICHLIYTAVAHCINYRMRKIKSAEYFVWWSMILQLLYVII